MRNTITLFVFALLVIFGFLVYYNLTKDLARPAIPVKLATGEYEPFVGSGLEGYGPVSQIVVETMDRIGHIPHIEVTSWNLAEQKTDRHEVFGTFPWIDSERRNDKFILTDPLISFDYGFFYLKDSFPDIAKFTEIEDIKDFKFGIIDGYDPWDTLRKVGITFSDTLATVELAFELLARGDIDFLMEGKLPGYATLRGNGVPFDPRDFGFIGPEHGEGFGDRAGLSLMVDKGRKAREFVGDFNAELDSVKASIWYKEIVHRLNAGLSEFEYVEIHALENQEFIYLTDIRSGKDILIPHGSNAIILEWPAAYLETGDSVATTGELHCRVKLLNGPRRGGVFWADVRLVYLFPKAD